MKIIDNFCVNCGKDFKQPLGFGHKTKYFCCDKCAFKYYERNKIGRTYYDHICKNCGKLFSTKYKNSEFCNRKCSAIYRNKKGEIQL